MCFNARYRLEIALKRAIRKNNKTEIDHWRSSLKQYDKLFQVSGFAHPEIIIYSNDEPFQPQLSVWGLVPHWATDAESIWNKMLNARGETIFEKSSFRKSAEEKRCLIPVEGFYEHHHFRGRTYPFYISQKEDKPLMFAGLWNKWTNPKTGEILNTCSIVTTKANSLMARIHNNPKLSGDSRMPLILPEELENEWLRPLNKNELQDLIQPYPNSDLMAHTVKRLSGKGSPGNVPKANKVYDYKELEFGGSNQLSLFT
jgi:putative SOS response-associated peptidase YedK